MSRLVVVGLGALGRLAKVCFEQDSPHDVAAFAVHERFLPRDERELLGTPVVALETLHETHPPDGHDVFVGVGFSERNRARARVLAEVVAAGYTPVTYVSSRAIVYPDLQIGTNAFVCEAAAIQPFCSVGSNTIVWGGTYIAHDVAIGDSCFIGPGATICGDSRIEDFCFIGSGATVRNGVTVRESCVVGAGALIMQDTNPGEVFPREGTKPTDSA